MNGLWISLCISCEYPVNSVVLSPVRSSCYHPYLRRAITRSEWPQRLASQAFARLLTYITKRITKIMGPPLSAQKIASGRRVAVKTGQPTGQWPAQASAPNAIERPRKSPQPSLAVSGRLASAIRQCGGASGKHHHALEALLRRADRPKAQSPMPRAVSGVGMPPKAGYWPGRDHNGPDGRDAPSGEPHGAVLATAALTPATDAAVDVASSDPYMRMLLWRFPGRSHTWLRFGAPFAVHALDAQRRIALFAPHAVCCRVQWVANAYGPIFWQLMILQAGSGAEAVQRVRGVAPGAHMLLHAQGERSVRQMLHWLDNMNTAGIELGQVAPIYWRTVHNRLAARMALPPYTEARRFAHQARQNLCTGEDGS